MNLIDIIEGYLTLRKLKREGYVEEDNLTFGGFLKLVFNAEKNIRNMEKKGVDVNEDK